MSWRPKGCEAVSSFLETYPLPTAAALWCGTSLDGVDTQLMTSTEISDGVFRDLSNPCLEQCCLALHKGIDSGGLLVRRDNGDRSIRHLSDPVARRKRYINRQELKEWMAKEFPDNKPSFLFDEIERNTHPAITKDVYQAQSADLKRWQSKAETTEEKCRTLQSRNAEMEKELSLMKSELEKNSEPGLRATGTYLNIIGVLNKLLLDESNSSRNQESIISEIQEKYPNKPGLSIRTLQEKFAEAKRHVEGS